MYYLVKLPTNSLYNERQKFDISHVAKIWLSIFILRIVICIIPISLTRYLDQTSDLFNPERFQENRAPVVIAYPRQVIYYDPNSTQQSTNKKQRPEREHAERVESMDSMNRTDPNYKIERFCGGLEVKVYPRLDMSYDESTVQVKPLAIEEDQLAKDLSSQNEISNNKSTCDLEIVDNDKL